MNLPSSQSSESSISAELFWQQSAGQAIIDVRSPGEFAKGHIPGAVSLPLFSDEERAEIGTTYHELGTDEAVMRGLGLVGPKMVSIVEQAKQLAQGQKSIWLYCWRGGMRSNSVAWLLNTAGLKPKLLCGGYKAFRGLTRKSFEQSWPLTVISGLTGVGKTRVLQLLHQAGEQVLDLERLANHRGSAFGGIDQPAQPSTEQFENDLFAQAHRFDFGRRIWIEDEGNRIGTVVVPNPVYQSIRHAPAIFLDSTFERRVENLVVDYGNLPSDSLIDAITKIRKRLGPQNCDTAISAIQTGDVRTAIRMSLAYYDRTYLKSVETMPRSSVKTLKIDSLTADETVAHCLKIANELDATE